MAPLNQEGAQGAGAGQVSFQIKPTTSASWEPPSTHRIPSSGTDSWCQVGQGNSRQNHDRSPRRKARGLGDWRLAVYTAQLKR